MNQIEVDARGLRCPLPVIRLAATALQAPAGTRVILLADDPAARYDVPAWCRMRGHELLELTELPELIALTEPTDPTKVRDPAYLRFVVLIQPQPPKAAGTGSGSERPSRET